MKLPTQAISSESFVKSLLPGPPLAGQKPDFDSVHPSPVFSGNLSAPQVGFATRLQSALADLAETLNNVVSDVKVWSDTQIAAFALAVSHGMSNTTVLLPLVAMMVMSTPKNGARKARGPKAVRARSRPVATSGSVFNPGESFSLGNNLSAFPLFVRRTLRYSQSNVIDVANFGTSQQVFRSNSLFDPDLTGTGHQPNGFDQLMVAYNHFTVIRSRISVRVLQVGTGGGAIEPGAIVLGYSDSGTFMASQADYPTALEKRNVMATAFYGSSTSTGNTFVLKGSLDIPRLLRKTEQQIVEMANLRGDSASNPTEGYFFEVGLFSFSSNPGAITLICTLEYDAIFSEPRFNSGDS